MMVGKDPKHPQQSDTEFFSSSAFIQSGSCFRLCFRRLIYNSCRILSISVLRLLRLPTRRWIIGPTIFRTSCSIIPSTRLEWRSFLLPIAVQLTFLHCPPPLERRMAAAFAAQTGRSQSCVFIYRVSLRQSTASEKGPSPRTPDPEEQLRPRGYRMSVRVCS